MLHRWKSQIIRRYQAGYPRIKVFINDRNSGNPCKQWDRGVIEAKGEYVWIAESDDVAAPDFLERMTPVLDKHCNVGLVYCSCKRIDAGGQFLPDKQFGSDKRRTSDYILRGTDEMEQSLYVNNSINNVSGALFRKTAYVETGMADMGMRYCGDWFLYLRMLRASDFGYVSSPMNYLRIHDSSSHYSYYRDQRYLEEVMRIYDYILKNTDLPPSVMESIREQISRHFCAALKNKLIPSSSVLKSMRQIVPCFGWNVARFLMNRAREKYL